MRQLLLFLVAFGLGSLVAVGQEGDRADAELKAEIDALARKLEARLEKDRKPADLRNVTRAYDVSDLCLRVRNDTLDPTNLRPSAWGAPDRTEDASFQLFEVDAVIELCRVSASPESWDVVEGADIQPKQNRLFVANLPSVHKEIEALLKTIRAALGTQLEVEVTAVPVSPETAALLAKRPGVLGDDEAKALLAQAPLGSARVVCVNGQRVVARSGKERPYVADYVVQGIGNKVLGAPERAQVFEGCAVEIQAAYDGDHGALLHFRMERTALEAPVRTAKTRYGALDLPSLQLTRLNTSAWIPLGSTFVLGGGTRGAQPCVFLVRARIAE